MYASTGDKTDVAIDYLSPARGLTLRRLYRYFPSIKYASTATPQLGTTFTSTSVIFDYSIRYAKSGACLDLAYLDGTSTCVPLIGSGDQIYLLRRPNGSLIQFNGAASAPTATAEVNVRLTQQTNAQGAPEWRIYNEDNTLEIADPRGLVTERTTADGRRTYFAYADGTSGPDGGVAVDGAGNPTATPLRSGLLVRQSDDVGRTLTFAYDANGRLVHATTPSAQVYRYRYDDKGNLIAAIFPDGSQRAYAYNEAALTSGTNLPRAMTGIVDENGSRYASYSYDTLGRTIQTVHDPDGGAVDRNQYAYDLYGLGASITDPLGTTRTQNYAHINNGIFPTGESQPGGSGCSSASSSMSYDNGQYTRGNVTSRWDFDHHQTTYTYNLTRNLETQRVEAVYTAQARTISTQWHPDWRLEARRAEPKKLTSWVYNGQMDPVGGSILNCAPGDALLPDGKPIAVLCKKIEQATTDATGASAFGATVTGTARTWTYTYNRYGQVLTAKGPRSDVNDTTAYAYYGDTDGNHTLGDLESVTDALGHVTHFTRYDADGHLLETTDANGVTTTLTYTVRGWLKTRQTGSELTTYDYDNVGQLTRVTASDGSWIGYDYDAAHRLTAISDNRGDRIAYTLDNAGNRIREEVSDPAGNLVRTQDRVYDALSRLQNTIQPE